MTYKNKYTIKKSEYAKTVPDSNYAFVFSNKIEDWIKPAKDKKEYVMDNHVPNKKISATVKMKGRCNNIGKFL